MFLSFLVKFVDGWKVVVGSTISFDVDAHWLEHLKVLTIAILLKDLSLVLLEEPVSGKSYTFSGVDLSELV